MDERTRWDLAAADKDGDAEADAPPLHSARNRVGNRIGNVVYGPWAQDEGQLRLLGSVEGRRILDLGCGEGENTVTLARAGAQVTGLDISPRRIAHAQNLAAVHDVAPAWRVGDMHDPALWRDLNCDLILATYVLPYSRAPVALLQLCRDGLRPGGLLVAAMDHPLRACFWDADAGEVAGFPLRDYHDPTPLIWRIHGTPVAYAHRTVAEWVDLIRDARMNLLRIVEPAPPAGMREDYWPQDSALAPLGHIPHTLILIAQRPAEE